MSTAPTPARPSMLRIYLKVLLIPLSMLAAWLLYYAVNTLGMPEETTAAEVVGKRTVEAGSNYHTTIVGGHLHVQGGVGGEVYLVELQLANERVGSFVSAAMYEKISVGDTVDVRYRRTRLGGRTQMVELIESSLSKG